MLYEVITGNNCGPILYAVLEVVSAIVPAVRPWNDPLKTMTEFVITSYSIHYTKLYEAAVSALVLTLLSAGDHIIASEVCYSGSVELFGIHLPRFGIRNNFV